MTERDTRDIWLQELHDVMTGPRYAPQPGDLCLWHAGACYWRIEKIDPDNAHVLHVIRENGFQDTISRRTWATAGSGYEVHWHRPHADDVTWLRVKKAELEGRIFYLENLVSALRAGGTA